MTAYQNITGSGYLNNPVRTVIIDRDNRPGSYPTHVSPIDLRRSETADLIRPFRDDLTVATPRAYATAWIVFGDVLPTPGSTLTLTGLSNPVGPATVSSVFEFQPLDVPATTPGAYIVSLAGVLTTAPDPGLPGLTPKQLTRRRAAERLIEAVNAATGSLISARPGSAIGEVLLEQRVPGSAGNLSNSTTAAYLTVTDFSGGGDGSVRYPYGVQVVDGDPSLVTNELVRRVVRGVRSGTLDVPTSGRASLLDAPSDGHPYVAHSPFDETGAQVAFGINTGGSTLYGTQAGLDDPFITRGSISGSLDEPLGAKDKIEIDLTPAEETTLHHRTDGSAPGNYPMAYFNHRDKKWERIGFGVSHVSASGVTPSTLTEWLDSHYIGFGQGQFCISNRDTIFVEVLEKDLLPVYTSSLRHFRNSWSSPIDAFGFPSHPKFHATSSQALDVSSLVDRPFLVEKMVYEFDISSIDITTTIGNTNTSQLYACTGGTFFILNQRKSNPQDDNTKFYVATDSPSLGLTGYPAPFSGYGDPGSEKGVLYDFTIPDSRVLSQGASPTYVDTIRDIVTFARVGTIHASYQNNVVNALNPGFPHPASYMDLAIEVSNGGSLPQKKRSLASNIKSPTLNPSVSVHRTNNGGEELSSTGFVQIYTGKVSATRNGLDLPTGRANNAEFGSSVLLYKSVDAGGIPPVSPENQWKATFAVKNDGIDSPYIIRPGDQLIFGWQSLITDKSGPSSSNWGPRLTLNPGTGKLILYGSYLQDDKPVHDIFKDQLNSDAAHETIPSGPWVLDRFESEPQMMFSSSMREEHVTGTMVTRNSDGTLSVTDPGDLNIGGVRAVSARASDGDLGQRWSFFRNNRLFDSEEQYYDSMQPNPVDILFTDPNVRAYGAPGIGYVSLMLPGETYIGPSTLPNTNTALNTYSNRNFFVRYPFQEEYEGIARVKKINSRVLTGQDVPAFFADGLDNVTLTSTQINSAILFLTGWTGTPGPATFSNFSRRGGIYKPLTTTTFNQAFIFPFTSKKAGETNPTRTNYLPADPRVDDPITKINYWVSRFMGCFGDGFLRMCQFKEVLTANAASVTFQILDYRGTKHGLINPIPLFSSAVFNGTQFGQLRDLMEQRQYTRFSLNDSSLTDAAVEVVFIDRSVTPDINGSVTNNIVTGSATNSSNVSPFATSEHPYDDALADSGLIWDRDTPLPEDALAF